MDSLRVSVVSAGSGMVYWMDIIPAILMCVMFALNIYYLWLKTKKIKES